MLNKKTLMDSNIIPETQKGIRINENIIKMIIQEAPETSMNITWSKGANAKLYYQVHAFVHPHKQIKRQKHNSCCSHRSHSIHAHTDESIIEENEVKEDEQVKPERRFVSNSKSYTDSLPFELRIGYDFSVKAFETSIRSMKVGERARFLWLSMDDTSVF